MGYFSIFHAIDFPYVFNLFNYFVYMAHSSGSEHCKVREAPTTREGFIRKEGPDHKRGSEREVPKMEIHVERLNIHSSEHLHDHK